MSSLALRGHEFYVKVGDDTAALERLRAVVGADCSVVRGPGSAYCVVLWADETFDPPEQRELQVRTLFRGNDDVPEQELRRVWAKRLLVVDSAHPRLVAIDARMGGRPPLSSSRMERVAPPSSADGL